MRIEFLRPIVPFRRNMLIGELRLQSCEEANVFYATSLFVDQNMGLNDFSNNPYWRPTMFTHQYSNATEDIVIIDGDSTIIQGIYKDRFGEMNKANNVYMVNVYIWIETEEEERGAT